MRGWKVKSYKIIKMVNSVEDGVKVERTYVEVFLSIYWGLMKCTRVVVITVENHAKTLAFSYRYLDSERIS